MLHRASLSFVLLGCADKAGRSQTDDTGPPIGESGPLFTDRGCHDDGVGEPGDIGLSEKLGDVLYRIVDVENVEMEDLYAVVFFPEDGNTAWDDGAPVVVVVPPALTVDESVESLPKPLFDARFGVVEIQPIYPGWTVAGVTGGGEPDDAGLQSAAALWLTMRFAAGLHHLTNRATIGQFAGLPVCNARIGLATAGLGGVTLMQTLAPNPDAEEWIAGVAMFETPSVPQLITGDAGWTWMDPDPEVDGDGNGLTWDDGRNIDWTSGSCSTSRCELDYSTLSYDAEAEPSAVFPGRFVDASPGVMYLDRNGSGTLDYLEDGGLDVDGDGAIGATDDFVLLPHYAWDGSVYYNDHLLADGRTSLPDVPEGVEGMQDSAEFWSIRTVLGEGLLVAAKHPPTVPFVVGYSAADHLMPLSDRPHLVGVHDLFSGAGFPTRYNLRGDALDCLVDPALSDGWAGGPERGTILVEAEMQDWAMPDALDDDALALSAMSMLWDAFGAFDNCPVW